MSPFRPAKHTCSQFWSRIGSGSFELGSGATNLPTRMTCSAVPNAARDNSKKKVALPRGLAGDSPRKEMREGRPGRARGLNKARSRRPKRYAPGLLQGYPGLLREPSEKEGPFFWVETASSDCQF